MDIYFTSDTHAWHTNIIRYCNRPFASAEAMTRALADNINAMVRPGDVLYHLGDFAFGTPAAIIHFREMIECRQIHLILGNHDKRIAQDKGLHRLFQRVHNFGLDVKVGSQHIVLCHYAMRVWNHSHHSAWHLYGHSHGSLPEDAHALSFDVGVDSWGYRPVSYAQIAGKMASKVFQPIDHHADPQDPGSHTCECCKKRPSNGTIGSMDNPDFKMWVCEDCYHNVLRLKPLVEIVRENEHQSTGTV